MSYVEKIAATLWMLWCIAAFLALADIITAGAVNDALSHRDNTDTPVGRRSGLGLYVDHLTGCQYLGRSGALTVRLDESGRPMCGGGR